MSTRNSPSPFRPTLRTAILLIKIALAAGLLAWLFAGERFDWSALTAINEVRPLQLLLLAGLLVVLSILVGAERWRRLSAGCGFDLRLVDAFSVNYVGALFNNFVFGGQGGDLIRLGLVARAYPDRKMDAAAVLVVDRVLGVVGLCLTGTILTIVAWPDLSRAARIGGALQSMFGVGILVGLLMTLSIPFTRLPGGRLVSARLPSLPAAYELLRSLRTRGALIAAALALSVVVHGLCLIAVALCAHALALSASALQVMWGSALTMLANIVPIMPGNLGVTEMLSGEIFLLFESAEGAALFATYRVLAACVTLPALALFLRDAGGVRFGTPAADVPELELDEPGTPA